MHFNASDPLRQRILRVKIILHAYFTSLERRFCPLPLPPNLITPFNSTLQTTVVEKLPYGLSLSTSSKKPCYLRPFFYIKKWFYVNACTNHAFEADEEEILDNDLSFYQFLLSSILQRLLEMGHNCCLGKLSKYMYNLTP